MFLLLLYVSMCLFPEFLVIRGGDTTRKAVVEKCHKGRCLLDSYLYSYCNTFDLGHRKATMVVVLYEKAKCIFPALLRNIIRSIIFVRSE